MRGHRSTVLSTVCAAFIAVGASSAFANDVKITGSETGNKLTVKVSKATTVDVLRSIGRTYKFQIAGLMKVSGGIRYSTTFRGNLDGVIKRLLRNKNHLIIRSSKLPGGIQRIVILDGKSGSGNVAPPVANKGLIERRRERIRRISKTIAKSMQRQ